MSRVFANIRVREAVNETEVKFVASHAKCCNEKDNQIKHLLSENEAAKKFAEEANKNRRMEELKWSRKK